MQKWCKIAKTVYRHFEINTGVRQGDGLSSLLFNIAVEECPRRSSHREKVNLLVFADDEVIVTKNKEDLKEITKILMKEAAKMGLQVDESKTKFMKLSTQKDYLTSLNCKFKKTDHFKYL